MKTKPTTKTTKKDVPATRVMSPSPEQIKSERARAGLTQTEAAVMISSELRRWQSWESGAANMHPGLFELFQIKTRLVATMEKHTVPAAKKSGRK